MHIIFLAIAALISFNTSYTQELPVYKKTEHFIVVCPPSQNNTADDLLNESERFFEQLSHDLKHNYSEPITIRMYSDATSLQRTPHQQKNPGVVVSQRENHTYAITNTFNDSSTHSYEGMMQANKLQLAQLFIADKYQNVDIPEWLQQGLALYLADYISDEEVEIFKNSTNTLPTLEELENSTTHDNEKYEQHNAIASYLLVKFIDTQWKREKLLAVIDNYAQLESILRYPKKDIEKHWNYNTFFTVHAFKSGDPALTPLIKDLFMTFKRALSAPHKKRTVPQLEEIVSSFTDYEKKIIESDNHLLITIENNIDIAGWALFSLQSESRVILQAACIDPEYRQYDIGTKLINAVNKKFRHIKSITTANPNMNLKTPCFCGHFDYQSNNR